MRIDDGKEMHAGLRHVAAVNKKSMRTCAIAGFPVGTMVAHLENSESKARKLSMYRSMDLKYAVPRCGANSARMTPKARCQKNMTSIVKNARWRQSGMYLAMNGACSRNAWTLSSVPWEGSVNEDVSEFPGPSSSSASCDIVLLVFGLFEFKIAVVKWRGGEIDGAPEERFRMVESESVCA